LPAKRVVVIGAGMGGLAAAIDLARQGVDVEVIERAATPGGKMREVSVGDAKIDAGPTVFTMRWVFESLFADAGANLSEELQLQAMTVLARHAWRQGGNLDLFADVDQSTAAIGEFAGAHDANGYRAFCKRGQEIYQTLRGPYISQQRPSPFELVRRVGWRNLGAMWRTSPTRTLWSALGDYFHDPRLRQLFARYATYVGSSPLLAPATLMLIAHVEQDGVWTVNGGMRRVADALQKLGERCGARYRFNTHVELILTSHGTVSGLKLANGEQINCDAIVFNGDVSALGHAMVGDAVASAAPVITREARSLSAVTWCVRARTSGFKLRHHNVFFAEDYPAEFDAIFGQRSIVSLPTVYVCAQDRADELVDHEKVSAAPERLLILINAPADGDVHSFSAEEIAGHTCNAFGLMQDCGLVIETAAMEPVATTPAEFDRLFPGTGGALYGRANHGSMASFARPGARSAIKGLYLAGGSVHPGPGIPMATLSGRLAAQSLLADFAQLKRRR
jgi:1-hydroxycarotenoid 3,4-desaturase